MRNNQPVTNTQKDYDSSQKIVSTTDAKGVINDINEHFVNISGFTRKELIGQAHNLVRHPSMPQAAFKEMWDHNKSQKPWVGMVKNRCKNGDHYWVDAFVTPVYENGQVSGYQSVRQKPSPELIDRAEKVYSQIGNPIASLMQKVRGLPLMAKLAASFSFSAIAGILLVASLSSVGAIAAVIVINCLLALLISKPWSEFAQSTKGLFDSELAKKVYANRGDELGQIQLAMHFLQSQQDTILYRSAEMADDVKSASESALKESKNTEVEVNSMYQEVEMAATATHEMSATVQEVAKNSASTSDAADASKQSVASGKLTLQNTKAAMDALVVAVDESSSIIQNLSQDSSAIDSVVEVISGIAEQTNLLALNAAIEAARAGEQGRGFAVVADEVRALAAKTQESTGQISTMISSLQKSAGGAVSSISVSHEKVRESVDNVDMLDEQFATILSSVDSISDMCLQIASATEEQSSVADEISSNINNINQVGQNTIKAIADVSRTNESLMATSNAMHIMIKQFGDGSRSC